MGGLVRGMQWLNLAYIDLSFLDASAHRNDTSLWFLLIERLSFFCCWEEAYCS